MKIQLGEFFCGPGGLALGAALAGIKAGRTACSITHTWANDIDPVSCETYRHNICPDSPHSVICDDVRNLSERLHTLASIDAFAFGFPCNDFSLVGEQKGINGKFGPLYTYGVKVLDRFKPKWFLAENVGGLSSSNGGEAFQKILEDLSVAGNGYNLTAHLYKFEEYGVPQTRHRIIIIGIDQSMDLWFKVPKPTGEFVSAQEALENPPIPPDAPNQEKTKQSKTVVERLKNIKPGENAWTADLPEHLRLNVKNVRLSQIYKRLDPEKPAYTITGSGGGGTHGYHWSEDRALTNRERARLQTFPDSFEFKGSKEKVRKQIGMAVPVKGAIIIFASVLKTIKRIDYEYIEPSIGYIEAVDKEQTASPQLSLAI